MLDAPDANALFASDIVRGNGASISSTINQLENAAVTDLNTIAVPECVIERIHALKGKTITVRAGRAKRTYQLVKSHQPQDLVFQSVKDGRPMRDNNILTRFIKPAARELGLDFVNWRCLRTSHATWLKMAGADVKDAQAQLRHSRASTTLDIYQQFVPESQHRAVDRLASLSKMVN